MDFVFFVHVLHFFLTQLGVSFVHSIGILSCYNNSNISHEATILKWYLFNPFYILPYLCMFGF